MPKQNHNQKISDDILIECFEKHKHLGKISTELNLPSVTVYRRLSKLGLKTEKQGSGKKIDIDEILMGMHPYYQTFKLRNRLIKEKIIEYKCDCCGISKWNNMDISLQLDHIDGNSTNHVLSNLRLLCPNCHSQTETWCGKNK